MRVLFIRDHEISGLGPAGPDPLTVGVRAAGPGRTARPGSWCRAGGRERAEARSQHYLAAGHRRGPVAEPFCRAAKDLSAANPAPARRYSVRSTAASSSGAPSVMNWVTMWPDPYRALISAIRSGALTGWPSGEVVKSQYRKASHSAPPSSGKTATRSPIPRSSASKIAPSHAPVRHGWAAPDGRCHAAQ